MSESQSELKSDSEVGGSTCDVVLEFVVDRDWSSPSEKSDMSETELIVSQSRSEWLSVGDKWTSERASSCSDMASWCGSGEASSHELKSEGEISMAFGYFESAKTYLVRMGESDWE